MFGSTLATPSFSLTIWAWESVALIPQTIKLPATIYALIDVWLLGESFQEIARFCNPSLLLLSLLVCEGKLSAAPHNTTIMLKLMIMRLKMRTMKSEIRSRRTSIVYTPDLGLEIILFYREKE